MEFQAVSALHLFNSNNLNKKFSSSPTMSSSINFPWLEISIRPIALLHDSLPFRRSFRPPAMPPPQNCLLLRHKIHPSTWCCMPVVLSKRDTTSHWVTLNFWSDVKMFKYTRTTSSNHSIYSITHVVFVLLLISLVCVVFFHMRPPWHKHKVVDVSQIPTYLRDWLRCKGAAKTMVG